MGKTKCLPTLQALPRPPLGRVDAVVWQFLSKIISFSLAMNNCEVEEQERLVPCVMAFKYVKYPPSLTKYVEERYTDTSEMLLRKWNEDPSKRRDTIFTDWKILYCAYSRCLPKLF